MHTSGRFVAICHCQLVSELLSPPSWACPGGSLCRVISMPSSGTAVGSPCPFPGSHVQSGPQLCSGVQRDAGASRCNAHVGRQ